MSHSWQAFTDSTTLKLDTVVLNRPGGITEELKQVSLMHLVRQSQSQAKSTDFNNDGVVDFRDFLLFAPEFGGTNPRFDLNGDGSVGFGDFLIFAADFGQ